MPVSKTKLTLSLSGTEINFAQSLKPTQNRQRLQIIDRIT
ncbi:hypothetical protein HMPREF0454_04989 [Hafnia alvei ATCC 51873]|uniref:Uncharacterized protein n=1 Tax=Hafnia alvei ATCC 51873 TaxID=1002364 RepID=G9YEE0_HAFAL|nr:hypothetical protein HMPREF0454_04989 [Hafnia alvei ATCC 51873]